MKNLSFVSLIILLNLISIHSQVIKHSPELNKENNTEYKIQKEKYFEEMNRTEPGINYKVLNEELRKFLREERNSKKLELLLDGKYNHDKLLSSEFADGRLSGSWIERGSNNQAGRTHLAEIAPNGTDLYVASSGGNIWKGTLDGENWKCLNDGFKFSDINLLKIVQINGKNRIYVAESKLLYYSDNDGITWNKSTGLETLESWGNIQRAIIASNDIKNSIYVMATEWDYKEWKSRYGLYKSYDNGNSFIKIEEFGTNIEIDIWGSAGFSDDLFIMKQDSLFVIQDDIISFLTVSEDMTYFLPNSPDLKMTGGYFDGEPVIYIAVQIDGTNERHIIKYNSLQNQFKFMGTAPTNMFMRNSIEVSKIDQNRLWLGGVNCYTSIDGGMTWELINQWYAYYQDVLNKLHADIPSINAFKIADNKEVIFINTDGGTYRSIGDNYILKNISLKGLNVSQYYSIYSYSGDEGNYIYAGAQDQGFQFGLVNGKLPVDMVQSISGDYGNLSSGNNGNALWMVYPGFALIYPDLPNNTSSVTWDFVGKYENRVWMPPVVAIPGRPSDAIIAPGGSNNNSTLWRLEYSKNFIYPYEMPFVFDEQEPGNDVSAIAISELDTNYYYATTKLGRFYYSTDAGKTWDYNKDDTGIGYNYLHGSAILPSKLNLGTVYFAGSGYSNPGVYVTYDNGINVEALGENMPKVFFYSLAASADELAIFAATSVGPYVYLKGINRWYSMMSLDSPEQVYWSVNFIPEDNVVRFATYGRGIWDFQIDKINNVFNEQNNANISAVEVFPNPTTQFVQINLSNIGNKNISARIFDIDGNLVCNVVNGNSYNDNYSYTWDLTNFAGIPVANGTYILVYVIDGLNNYQKINVAR